MRFCPDANALISYVLADQRTSVVEQFWTELAADDELICAQIFLPECTSTVREKVFRGQLTHAEGLTIVNELLQLPLRLSQSPYQFTRAMDLANQRHMLKSYDMQYVAVAEIERCTMVTLDGGVYQAAIEIGVQARLLR